MAYFVCDVIAYNPAGIYLLKVNDELPEPGWRRSVVFSVNSKHTSHNILVFLLLILELACNSGNNHLKTTMKYRFWEKVCENILLYLLFKIATEAVAQKSSVKKVLFLKIHRRTLWSESLF